MTLRPKSVAVKVPTINHYSTKVPKLVFSDAFERQFMVTDFEKALE